MSDDKIIIIILTHNEEKTIKDVILECKKNINPTKILIIDAYSDDETSTIAKQNGAEVIFVDKYFGISLGVEAGILAAYEGDYDYLIRVDGDGQHFIPDVKKIYENTLKNNIDLMIGSRFLKNSDYKPSIFRNLGIIILRGLLNILYGVKILDCTSGCQVISKKLINAIIDDKNFEYSEIGIICKTKKINFNIKEEFINMKPRLSGKSSFNFINSFKYMFRNLLALITSFSFK